ncbi:Heptosyltransferase family protein, lipopolysaccharide core biosynthesis [Candidatus Burkholderia pumila]|uniref:Heptosyltransferase family protein, lipopolysaccharide core biosynthesis n=1 Tax=Candidatus Burkholderia pumila TaxID=1090375 RepID=A0ABR5HKK0_9BURK|nr:Heptosyltransferase family protein, lipopolysaccharide core biosynthesis [Candidatus Burkholderia pumila]
MSRLSGRLRVIARAIPKLALKSLRHRPTEVSSILIAHHLLLGDTLLLTPLIAKLRERFPHARVALTCSKPIVPLYAGRPYGAEALPFDPRDLASVKGLLKSGPYDLGIVAGDNRFAWLAISSGCRWIIGHGGDVPDWKNWPVDEAHVYPSEPAAWADITATLIDGPPPQHYRPDDWSAPERKPLSNADADLLTHPYVVLHPGASTAVKKWPQARWLALAERIEQLGLTPVWSGGPSEATLVREIDPENCYTSFAGRLGLGELWYLFANARALVCPDTGVAHLGRMADVPTLTLFGPGNAKIHGVGAFWRDARFTPITIADMPCRDEPVIFRRHVGWARRCDRNETTCVAWRGDHADCMGLISLDSVSGALEALLTQSL